MNRYLTFSLAISMTLSTLAIPLRAANKPRAEMEKTTVQWTNEDLERLRALGLISSVGQPATAEAATAAAPPSTYVKHRILNRTPSKQQSCAMNLKRRQARLREYRQAFDDARCLREMTGGINLDEGDVGITPEAGIEILQRHVKEAQTKLDALEDLARRDGIPPGTLRGQ